MCLCDNLDFFFWDNGFVLSDRVIRMQHRRSPQKPWMYTLLVHWDRLPFLQDQKSVLLAFTNSMLILSQLTFFQRPLPHNLARNWCETDWDIISKVFPPCKMLILSCKGLAGWGFCWIWGWVGGAYSPTFHSDIVPKFQDQICYKYPLFCSVRYPSAMQSKLVQESCTPTTTEEYRHQRNSI